MNYDHSKNVTPVSAFASKMNKYLLAILIAIATWSYFVLVNILYNLAPVLLVSKSKRSPDSTIFKK